MIVGFIIRPPNSRLKFPEYATLGYSILYGSHGSGGQRRHRRDYYLGVFFWPALVRRVIFVTLRLFPHLLIPTYDTY